MKRIFAWTVVGIGAVAAPCWMACSGDTTTESTTDGGTDSATPDVFVQPDVGMPDNFVMETGGGNDAGMDVQPPIGDGAAVQCGANTCGSTEVCCVTVDDAGATTAMCANDCGDGGITVRCLGPENCTAAAQFCCGTIKTGAGQPPNCPIESVDTQCKAMCNTKLNLACNATETARLCHHNVDCAGDNANPTCCEFQNDGGGNLTFCVSDTIAQFSGCTPQP